MVAVISDEILNVTAALPKGLIMASVQYTTGHFIPKTYMPTKEGAEMKVFIFVEHKIIDFPKKNC